MSKLWFFVTFILLFSFDSVSTTVNKKIYINRGISLMVDSSSMKSFAFNSSSTFDSNNLLINLNVGDSLSLWVINNDSIVHDFSIKNISSGSVSIQPGDSTQIGSKFVVPGCYIYYDPLNYPDFAYAGLSGMVTVSNSNNSKFYWNLKEHSLPLNEAIYNGGSVNWSQYDPEYFTINGKSAPHINQDNLARITGNVGDTIIIYIANTGQSVHSLHFHGYHETITFSSKHSDHVGWSKDTFPIKPMETLVLELVPDKPGEYPVHDHNLVATTGNGWYPNGMFTTMLISP